MAIFDRLFGRRKKDEAPEGPQRPDSAQHPQASEQSHDSVPPQSPQTAEGHDRPEAPSPAPAAPSDTASSAPSPTAPSPTVPAPAAAPSPTAPEPAPAAAPSPTVPAPAPAPAPTAAPSPTAPTFAPPRQGAGQRGAAPASSFTNEDHLDGWEPSRGIAEALDRFRAAPAGLKAERARRELSRHLVGTGLFTILGPGGDGRPTIKATVVNSVRLLTVYTSDAAAQQATQLKGAPKNGQVAEIPGEVILAWILSQPKVQGLRLDPLDQDAPMDFTRDQVGEAVRSLVNMDLRRVLVSENPTPQKGLEAIRAEGNQVLVVQRRTAQGVETMQLTGSGGETVLPVFTSEAEAFALGTSLRAEPMEASALRGLVAELGIATLRANPAGPSLDMPAASL